MSRRKLSKALMEGRNLARQTRVRSIPGKGRGGAKILKREPGWHDPETAKSPGELKMSDLKGKVAGVKSKRKQDPARSYRTLKSCVRI